MKGFIAFVFAAAASAAHANLLVNGSFENTANFTPDGNNTMSLAAGSTAMIGWTTSVNEIAWIKDPNPFNLTASEGIFSLDLMGYHDFQPTGMISQSFGTVIGSTYTVSFDIGRGTHLVVSAGGTTVNRFNGNSTTEPFWNTETFTFVASTNTATLTVQGGANTNPQYAGVDNLIVDGDAVPEPATVAIIAAGLAAIAKRRKSR